MGSGITRGTTVTATPRHNSHGTPRGASRAPATTATGTNDGLPDATVPGNHYFIYLTSVYSRVQVCALRVCATFRSRRSVIFFAFLHTSASCASPPLYVQRQFRRCRYWLVNVARGNSIRYQKDIESMCRQKSSRSIYICVLYMYIVGDLREPRKLDTVYHFENRER